MQEYHKKTKIMTDIDKNVKCVMVKKTADTALKPEKNLTTFLLKLHDSESIVF